MVKNFFKKTFYVFAFCSFAFINHNIYANDSIMYSEDNNKFKEIKKDISSCEQNKHENCCDMLKKHHEDLLKSYKCDDQSSDEGCLLIKELKNAVDMHGCK
jgi:hypothetical protein